MSFPYFISPEQAMRERSELARKGIARGRSVVALVYAGGVLFVAENPSRSLQKISELYDRSGSPRRASTTNSTTCAAAGSSTPICAATPTTGAMSRAASWPTCTRRRWARIFTEQAKPYEVELCVAEVAHYGESKPLSCTGSPMTARSPTSRISW